MKVVAWRTQMARSLPFYYGWVIVANTVSVSLSTRTVMAVAMLSVFVVPMTKELDWSRGLFSGAVSLPLGPSTTGGSSLPTPYR